MTDYDIALKAACEKIVLPPRPLTEAEPAELKAKKLLARYERKLKIREQIIKKLGSLPHTKTYPQKCRDSLSPRGMPVIGRVIVMSERTRVKLLPLTAEEIISAYIDHRKEILDFGLAMHPNPAVEHRFHLLWYQVEL